jgi:hypothetical protein
VPWAWCCQGMHDACMHHPSSAASPRSPTDCMRVSCLQAGGQWLDILARELLLRGCGFLWLSHLVSEHLASSGQAGVLLLPGLAGAAPQQVALWLGWAGMMALAVPVAQAAAQPGQMFVRLHVMRRGQGPQLPLSEWRAALVAAALCVLLCWLGCCASVHPCLGIPRHLGTPLPWYPPPPCCASCVLQARHVKLTLLHVLATCCSFLTTAACTSQ